MSSTVCVNSTVIEFNWLCEFNCYWWLNMNSINSCLCYCEFIQSLNSFKFASPKLPPIAQKKKSRGKKKTKAASLHMKRRLRGSNCWRNWMLLMKILSLTMPTRKNLQRILERKTRKILLKQLKTRTSTQLFLLLTWSQRQSQPMLIPMAVSTPWYHCHFWRMKLMTTKLNVKHVFSPFIVEGWKT